MPLAEILVWWKRDWHWIKTNEIGDGMQPVYVAERPFMLPKIDAAWLVRGMSLYKEFDEIKNIWSTYLYKFPKQDIYLETLQQVLSTHAPEYSVQRDRFVQLTGNVLPHMNEDEAGIALTHSGHGGPISFLCGVCAAYGQLRIDEDLTSVHATIPLVGSIAQQE